MTLLSYDEPPYISDDGGRTGDGPSSAPGVGQIMPCTYSALRVYIPRWGGINMY